MNRKQSLHNLAQFMIREGKGRTYMKEVDLSNGSPGTSCQWSNMVWHIALRDKQVTMIDKHHLGGGRARAYDLHSFFLGFIVTNDIPKFELMILIYILILWSTFLSS